MCVLQVTERSLKFLQAFSPKAAFLMYFDWGLPPKEKGFNKFQISLSFLAPHTLLNPSEKKLV